MGCGPFHKPEECKLPESKDGKNKWKLANAFAAMQTDSSW